MCLIETRARLTSEHLGDEVLTKGYSMQHVLEKINKKDKLF
jgi:hypothetical protein